MAIRYMQQVSRPHITNRTTAMKIIIKNGKDIRANITPPYTQDEIEYATDCDDYFISAHGRAIIKQILSERDALPDLLTGTDAEIHIAGRVLKWSDGLKAYEVCKDGAFAHITIASFPKDELSKAIDFLLTGVTHD